MKKIFVFISVLMAIGQLISCSSGDEFTAEEVVLSPSDENQSEEQQNNQPDDTQGEGGDNEIVIPVFKGVIDLTDAQKIAVGKNNEFAFNFFRAISQSKDLKGKSSVVSPISLTYVLGMLNAGATGQTSQEITSLLGFSGEDAQSINELCRQLIDEAPKVDESVQLGLANCVAIDNSVSLESQYLKDMDDYYKAKVASVNFGTQEAVDFVNGWSNEHTEGVIPEIVKSLDGVMALMNAVYINAPWKERFFNQNTRNEKFTAESGKEQTLPMMHGTMNYCGAYSETSDFEAARLPYGMGTGDNGWSMYVLLPKKGKTVDGVLSSLTCDVWADVVKGMVFSPMKVTLPHFKTEVDMDLKEVLSAMGVPSIFLPKMELTGISTNYKDLTVSQVKQKVAIEVKEEGTEASAVTMMGLAGSNGREPKYVDFVCDHPFVYLIQEASSGAVFFIGTYRGE